MFLHILKYNFISALRVKQLNFWILIFPIILGTLFNIAFSGIMDSEKFKTIPVAIVEKSENKNFSSVVDSLTVGDTPMLKVEYIDEEKALDKLKNGDCKGIIYVDEKISLTVSSNGIEQSILKSFLEQYSSRETIITETAVNNPAALNEVIAQLSNEITTIETINLTDGNMDMSIQYFYNLIAMTCLFGSYLGVNTIINNQGNLSAVGARKCISSAKKYITLIAGLLSAYIVHIICLGVNLLYLIFVLRIDFGDKIPQIVLTTVIGGFAGIAMGFFIGSIGKISTNAKLGILTSISLILCFFSGLMAHNMRMKVENIFPILNKISPAALIADSFHSLNIYGVSERFYTNIITLIIISVIFTIGGLILTRRDSYANL